MKYTPTTESDLETLNRWVTLDPAHKDDTTGAFWLVPLDKDGKQLPGIICLKVEDDDGAVFYLKFENAVRVYAQFPPESEVSQERVARGLRRAFFYFAPKLKHLGYHDMFFDSVSETLVKFFKKLHFEEVKNFFKVRL